MPHRTPRHPPDRSGEKPAARLEPGPGTTPCLVHVATVPCTLFFLAGQPAFLRERGGLTVHAIASRSPDLARFGESQGVTVHPVEMARRVTPFADARSLFQIWRVLRRLRPLVVHAHTPKGGLLGMLAARLAGVPVRVYEMHGLPLITARGARRLLLRVTERISCRLAQEVLCVSHSIRRIALQEGLCRPDRIKVLLQGSVNGVDAARFRPASPTERLAARTLHEIPARAPVIGYVGRIARDKGIAELAAAWRILRQRDDDVRLVLAGEVDDSDPPPHSALAMLRDDPRVLFAGQVREVQALYAAMDIVVLPSYREGFPTVALEAAAMALPIVATLVPGCVDAVSDGETGRLVPARDPVALALAITGYLADPALREAHGAAARRRAVACFGQRAVWEATVSEYEALLEKQDGSVPGRTARAGGAARAAATARDA
jgi:glycosyltransferase involved in cell wall biosynthesis